MSQLHIVISWLCELFIVDPNTRCRSKQVMLISAKFQEHTRNQARESKKIEMNRKHILSRKLRAG